jgi:hypothetical protein
VVVGFRPTLILIAVADSTCSGFRALKIKQKGSFRYTRSKFDLASLFSKVTRHGESLTGEPPRTTTGDGPDA